LLTSEGARVLALDVAFPGDLPEAAQTFVVDLRDADELEAIARRAEGSVHGLASFAGIERGGRIDEVSASDWREVFDVNVIGTVNAVRSFLPDLVAQRGAIVLCSSQLSLAGARDCVAYAASKGAINSLCRSLAVDHAEQGVRVNAVAPGATVSPMMTRAFLNLSAAAQEAVRKRHALGRFGRAEETAAAASFLLSDEASFISGVVLPVDGGWSAA
jgi:NAD(P)-dependent dehydrogenase (short-subunit alcohol dehydrogenase family)